MVGCTLFSCAGIALLGLTHHWLPAAFGMLLFGVGWTSAYATIQAAAQLVCPPWVRARALAIYQLAQNGALTAGSFAWGWLGDYVGLADTLLVAAAIGLGPGVRWCAAFPSTSPLARQRRRRGGTAAACPKRRPPN